jgi:hypothetical protein
MPAQIRSNIETILEFCRLEVVARTGLDDSRVQVVQLEADQVPHVGAEQDVLLWPQDEHADREQIAAAGRVNNYRTRKVRVICRTRMVLDQVGQARVLLLDPVTGHHRLEDRVTDALEIFWPEDADENVVTTCPVRLGDWSTPRPDRNAAEWSSSSATLEINYERDVDQDRQ